MIQRIDGNQRHLVSQVTAFAGKTDLHHAPVGMATQSLDETFLFQPVQRSRHRPGVYRYFPRKVGSSIGMAMQQAQENPELGMGHVEFGKRTVYGGAELPSCALEKIAYALVRGVIVQVIWFAHKRRQANGTANVPSQGAIIK
jgi:hypothetical protein